MPIVSTLLSLGFLVVAYLDLACMSGVQRLLHLALEIAGWASAAIGVVILRARHFERLRVSLRDFARLGA